MKDFGSLRQFGALAAALLLTAALPVTASAASITGEIAVFGTLTADAADLSAATSISFPDPVPAAAGTGDFAPLTGTLATFAAFSFAPPSAPGTLILTIGGLTFAANAIAVDLQTPTALDLTLTGVYSAAGFDDTAGRLVLTVDSLGGIQTFSATGATVPVPGALLFLGSALAGLRLVRRRA